MFWSAAESFRLAPGFSTLAMAAFRDAIREPGSAPLRSS